jgi:NTE family protein
MPTALVLSAGGLFGAYQAGAWKALAGRFQPDLVVGASAGALNGWAIAGGASPEELIDVWLNPRMAEVTRPHFPASPWRGCIDPGALERQVRDLFARFQPRVPFSATMVEWPWLREVRVPAERITPAHLMASCAVPLGYPPVRIDGKWYVDGGVLDILPVWAAAEMGATRVIAVNALPVMPSLTLRAALRVFQALGRRPSWHGSMPIVHIRPPAPLGTIHDSLLWRAENMRRWIAQGEKDATQAINTAGWRERE